MLTRLQSGLLMAASVLMVLVGAYTAGSRAARRSMELKQEHQRTNAMRKAHETKQTMDALDDDAVRRRADRWVRKPGQ